MYKELDLLNELKTKLTANPANTVKHFSLLDLSNPMNLNSYGEGKSAIAVGHLGVELVSEGADNLIQDGYSERDNPEILQSVIHILTPRTNLPSLRARVKAIYNSWYPYPDSPEREYSRLVLVKAAMVTVTDTTCLWQEVVGCVLPRLEP